MAARVLLLLFVAFFLRADDLDDATAQWAKKILTHFAPDQTAHITWAPASANDPASIPSQTRVKTQLARALARRVRNPRIVEVKATWSENAKEYLLIAEIKADPETMVEIASMSKIAPPSASANSFRVDKHLLWQQEARILDIASMGDVMLVLDTRGLSRYERKDGAWKQGEFLHLDVPVVRDPRGRISVGGDVVTSEVSGQICRSSWQATYPVECPPGGRFNAGRNTMEEAGWPPHFARAEWPGKTLIAETDGTIRVYDAARAASGTVEGIGDAFVPALGCRDGVILASGPENRDEDTIALYALEDLKLMRRSDAVDLPGPVTEMRLATDGALAVVHNVAAERYEAYSISVDCGQ